MFYTATDFYNCAEFVFNLEDSFMKGYHTPAVVNLAFACEVYLKTLLENQGIEIKTHDLSKLFQKLPEECQQDILKDVSEDGFSLVDVFGISEIDRISRVFEDWRYNYEHSVLNVDLGFLESFCKALRECCCKVVFNSTWGNVKEAMRNGKTNK